MAEDGCPVSVAVAAAAAGAGGPSPRAWVWAQRPCRGWACVSACACVWLAPPRRTGAGSASQWVTVGVRLGVTTHAQARVCAC